MGVTFFSKNPVPEGPGFVEPLKVGQISSILKQVSRHQGETRKQKKAKK